MSILNDLSFFENEVGLHTPQTQIFTTDNSEILWLLLKASMAALTSGLGGFPLYFFGELKQQTMGFCIIFAAGLMTGCSVVLFMEALEFTSILMALIYSLIGVAIIHFISHFTEDIESFEFAGLKGSSATKALLIILSMSLHSLGEGISVGVSASSEHESIGLLVIFSLALHNIPEGIAVSILLMSKGMNVWEASLFSVICNMPQPLIAIPSYIFMDSFRGLLPIGFSIASGAMTYIVCNELIPESKDKLSRSWLLSTFFTSLGIIVAIAVCAK